MNRFCLKQGQGLKASAAHPHAELPLSNPPEGRPSTFAPKLRDLFFSVSLISMEEASTSGLNCCSRDRKGKQREKKMPSENEVDILMRLSVRRITRTGYMISCYLIGSHKTKTLSRPRKD